MLAVALFAAVYFYYRYFILKPTSPDTDIDPSLLNWSGQNDNVVTVIGDGMDVLYRQSEFNNGIVRPQINPVVMSKESSIRDLTSQDSLISGIPSEHRESLMSSKPSFQCSASFRS